MKKIHSKMKALERSQHFFHCKSLGIFPDARGQRTPLSVENRTYPSFYGSPGYLQGSKSEEDPIKNEDTRVLKKNRGVGGGGVVLGVSGWM